jgi:hypothetical protein
MDLVAAAVLWHDDALECDTASKSGKCMVYLQVGLDGIPMKLTILRPTGLWLEENALLSVQSYRFKPAL